MSNIEIKLLKEHSDKIIVYGMSCVGKTTFSNLIFSHQYFCFDALFDWHSIETLGLSIESNLIHICNNLKSAPKFVLDGWHLFDKSCKLIPKDFQIYVIYDDYDSIIQRYRVPVLSHKDHFSMYQKWYDLQIDRPIRYFKNDIYEFRETDSLVKT